jgi:mRNA interferase MazF
MNKGEIWLLSFPKKSGREQEGTRPAIVIANTDTDMILAIPLTSNTHALRFPHTIEIKRSDQNSLEKDSVALLFQLQSLDKKRFISKIGALEKNTFNEIENSLKQMLNL